MMPQQAARFTSAAFLSMLVLVLGTVTASKSALAQGASRPSRVEVITPADPVPVMADGKRVLAYELHITNFGMTPLTLHRIDVFADQQEQPLGTIEGSALQQLLSPVGKAAADTANLDAGRRVIVYMWLTIPPTANVPAKLRHTLSFIEGEPNQGPSSSGGESHIDDIVVTVSKEPVALLRPPFRSGEWLAGNGPGNSSVHRRSITALNGRTYIGQRFATDWVMVGNNENTFHDSRDKNENFWAYGQPVFAVADGEVTEVVDKFPDNKPGEPLKPVTLENIAGNHVIVRIAPKRYFLFAHLKAGSLRVHLHQQVRQGDLLAQVGNSGNTTAPHLHFQVMDANSALGAEGVPYILEDFTFLGFGRDFEQNHHPTIPHSHELPVDDAVVGFH